MKLGLISAPLLLIATSAFAGQDARQLTTLATTYQDQGRYAEAERTYLRAIALDPSSLPPLNGLASLYFETRQWSKAEKYTLRCLAISETAQQLGNLAAVYQNERRDSDAEAMYLKAMAQFETEHRAATSQAAYVLHNLASLRVSNDPVAASEYAERALAIWKATLGTKNPTYAQGLAHLAFIYDALGRRSDADALWTASLDTLEATAGRSSPAYVRLSRAYRNRRAPALSNGAPGQYTVDYRDLARR